MADTKKKATKKATPAAKATPAKASAVKEAPAKAVTASTAPVAAKSAAPSEKASAPVGKYYYALGRRKTATATVRLFASEGESMINGKVFSEAYPHSYEQVVVDAPFVATELDPAKYHFTAKVSGSGVKAQLDAIQLGIARAIVVMDSTLKPALKSQGLVTRDPRMVERKKPGLRKARRAEQFSKR